MNKFNIIEVVNRRYTHPRNIIAAFLDRLSHQSHFEGIESTIDPSGESGDGGASDGSDERSVPAEVFSLDEAITTNDGIPIGTTVEEELQLVDGVYLTTLPFDFFRDVWIDGLQSIYQQHFTLSGSLGLIPTSPLLTGTEVIAQYVVGYE